MKTIVRLALLALAIVLFAPSSAALPEYYFFLTPTTQSVVTGETGTFTITMNKTYDVGDAIFTIHSSDTSRVTAATAVVVPKGQTVANGTFTAIKVGGPVTITATQPVALGGKNQTASVVVNGAAQDSGTSDAGEEHPAEEEEPASVGRPAPSPSATSESENAAAPSSQGGCNAASARSAWAAALFAGVAMALALGRSRRRR